MDDLSELIQRVVESESDDVLELLAVAGLDPKTDLVGLDLSGCGFVGADLSGADLRATNLRGANLHGANLRGADLGMANLSGADLREADLHRTELSGANLHRAKLPRNVLLAANLHGAKLDTVWVIRAWANRRLGERDWPVMVGTGILVLIGLMLDALPFKWSAWVADFCSELTVPQLNSGVFATAVLAFFFAAMMAFSSSSLMFLRPQSSRVRTVVLGVSVAVLGVCSGLLAVRWFYSAPEQLGPLEAHERTPHNLSPSGMAGKDQMPASPAPEPQENKDFNRLQLRDTRPFQLHLPVPQVIVSGAAAGGDRETQQPDRADPVESEDAVEKAVAMAVAMAKDANVAMAFAQLDFKPFNPSPPPPTGERSHERSGPATEYALGLDHAGKKEVQKLLADFGHDPGRPDGLFGTKTRMAIAAFQRSKGVEDTGYLNRALYEDLQDKTRPPTGFSAAGGWRLHLLVPTTTPIPTTRQNPSKSDPTIAGENGESARDEAARKVFEKFEKM